MSSIKTIQRVVKGVRNRFASRSPKAYLLALVLTLFYVGIYWYGWWFDPVLWLLDRPSMWLRGAPADHWFLYGTLYTVAVLGFGVRTFLRRRDDAYQRLRTISVMFVQLGLAYLLPNWFRAINQPEFYPSYFWPLKPEYLWPGDQGMGWMLSHPGGWGLAFVIFGLLMILVATPVLTYYYGKRWYCSWICGCGALAETAGDDFRTEMPSSNRAWWWERALLYPILGLIVLITVALWLVSGPMSGSVAAPIVQTAARWYGFAIGATFSGVIGVGAYPLMGPRVWCRYGCPMAAILGMQQRIFSRFRISVNSGQCISCGACTRHCEMGIDVRRYAERGASITRASCVGCGICAHVCPRGVLRLENGPIEERRYIVPELLILDEDVFRDKLS